MKDDPANTGSLAFAFPSLRHLSSRHCLISPEVPYASGTAVCTGIVNLVIFSDKSLMLTWLLDQPEELRRAERELLFFPHVAIK